MTQFLAYLDAHPWALWAVGTIVAGVFSLILSRRSQIDAWAESNPRIAGVMKLLRGMGIDPWLVVQGLMLIVTKRLPAPPAPKTSRPPLLPLLLVCVAVLLVGCASAKPIPEDPAGRAQYFADAVVDAVEAKERAKAVALQYEAHADDGIRRICSELVTYRALLGRDELAEVDAACRGYLSTPEPAKLEPPPAPEPAPAPPEPAAPTPEPVESDAGAPTAPA
jgi:hypothetical protein